MGALLHVLMCPSNLSIANSCGDIHQQSHRKRPGIPVLKRLIQKKKTSYAKLKPPITRLS